MNSNYWRGKNVFITGINGFIGGNLSRYLVKCGANVIGLERDYTKRSFLFYEKISSKVTLVQGCITDIELLRRIIVEEQIQCCFHLAAQVEVGIAKQYPYLTWETNIRGTYSLLEAIRENRDNFESVVIASSDKAYGRYPRDKMPYSEDYPLMPKFPYDTSKACADLIAQSYTSDLYKLPIVVTRFSNIYGPGQLNFSALIPDCIKCALGYSDFVPRSDGSHVRDFIYVDDVIRLYSLIAKTLEQNPNISGEIFNAGSNNPKTVKEIVKTIFSLMGEKEKYEVIKALFNKSKTIGEIEYQHMNFDKVNKYFGWSPKMDFEECLHKTIKWYEKYLSFKNNISTIINPGFK